MEKKYSPYISDESETITIDEFTFEIKELSGSDYVNMTQKIGVLDENDNIIPNDDEIIPFCIMSSIIQCSFKTLNNQDWEDAEYGDKINSIKKLKPSIYTELTNKIMSRVNLGRQERLKKKSQASSGRAKPETRKRKKSQQE